MAGNRTIQILINALTNTKGFDDAQKQLIEVAEKAKAAGIGLDSAGKGARKMGEEMGGKRGQVADLTRAILVQIGASEGAGEAAKLAGIGLNFMEGAASGLNIAMASATAGIAFLIPLLFELFGATKQQKDANEGLADSFSGIADKLDEIIAKGGQVSKVEKDLAAAFRAERYKNQTEELKKFGDQIAANQREIEKLTSRAQLAPTIQADADAIRKFYPTVAQARDRIKELREENERLVLKGKELETAIDLATTPAAMLEVRMKALADADDKAKDSADKLRRSQEELNRAFSEGASGAVAARLRDLAPLIEKDSKALADMQRAGDLGGLSQELFEMLTVLPPEAENFAAAIANIGIRLDDVTPQIDDINAAFEESRRLFEEGVISGRTMEAIDRQLLGMIDQLRQLGIAVQSPFTQAQELVIELHNAIEDQLINSAMAFGDALATGITGGEVAWHKFFQMLIRDLIATIIKALILRAIMAAIGFSGGGAVSAAGGAGTGAPNVSGLPIGQLGGTVLGGIPGEDSVRALLMPGEIVLPTSLAGDFREIAAMAREGRQARAGAAASVGPELALAVQILPRRNRQREAAELLDDINDLVERKGYRLSATKVLA